VVIEERATSELLDSCVPLAAEKFAAAGAAYKLVVLDDRATTGENCFGQTLNLDSFEHGIVDTHVMCLGTDDLTLVGIEDDEVGVGPDGDRAFARE
jgi:hypothetical protein